MKYKLESWAVTVCAAWLAVSVASAQSYPSKPIRLILTSASGGTAGLTGQLLAEHMGRALGQPMVIDYRPGQQGSIGTALGAKAPPDGYTLLLIYSANVTINPWMYRDVGYDPVKDFAHIGLAATTPLMVSVHPRVPASSLKDIQRLATVQPKRITVASGALGGQLAGKLFDMVARVQTVSVSYKGGGAAAADVAGGHVDVLIASPPSSMSLVRAGKLRAIAVTGTSRLSAAPEVPTSREAGFPEMQVLSWISVAAPSGTPGDVIARVSTALAEAVNTASLRERFATQGLDAQTNTPGQMAAYVTSEYEKWGKVIRAANVKAE